MKDVLQVIDKNLGLGCKFTQLPLKCSLPNGSIIYLTGADAKPAEMEKLKGQKFALVVVDEAASYKIDLDYLIFNVLEAAVADYEGTIALIGTPGNVTSGLFYKVTRDDGLPRDPGWEVFEWTGHDNPHMREKFQKAIDNAIARNPYALEDPSFQQMWLGKWVIDSNQLVYKWKAENNTASALPDARYSYVLGVDLGFEDATAFVVCAFSNTDPTLYILEAFKKSKMIISEVATMIQFYQTKYQVHRIVIDGSAKQAVEELRQRHNLNLTAADKRGKSDFINMMNSDLLTHRIKLLPGATDELVKEWKQLVWMDGAGKQKEDPKCENHLCDAALYAWRFSTNYRSSPSPVAVNPNSNDGMDLWWEKQSRTLELKKSGDWDLELDDSDDLL